jgi:hypothetical protein
MASISGMIDNRPLTEQEVIEYLDEIDNVELPNFEFESDSGSSNIGSIINSDSESENGEASHMARKRQHPNPPLFQWQSGTFTPTEHNFDNSNSGIQDGKIQDKPTALEIFQLFFSGDIMQKIANETIIIRSQHKNCHQNHDYRNGKLLPRMSFLFSLQS